MITVNLAGHVSFMNPAAETLTGVSADDAMGRPVRDVVRLLDPKQPASPLCVVLEQKRGIIIEEAPLEHATSASRIISDSASPVVDDGQMLGAVMVFRDITEQKVLQKQLELADRLASLGTMAAGVAHEVNNPLAVVVANACYALEELRIQQGLDQDSTRLESTLGGGSMFRVTLAVAVRGAVTAPVVPAEDTKTGARARSFGSSASRVSYLIRPAACSRS